MKARHTRYPSIQTYAEAPVEGAKRSQETTIRMTIDHSKLPKVIHPVDVNRAEVRPTPKGHESDRSQH
jgi:hypothetical protein